MFADPRFADRATACVLLLLGFAMLIGGFNMDRLEIRQIHPASIPGLVPMGLGLTMIICAALLFMSARSTSKMEVSNVTPQQTGGSRKNLLTSAVLCVGYAGVLVGNLPFPLATTLFIFCFALIFNYPEKGSPVAVVVKRLAFLALFSVIFAGGISALFQYGFLVRLP